MLGLLTFRLYSSQYMDVHTMDSLVVYWGIFLARKFYKEGVYILSTIGVPLSKPIKKPTLNTMPICKIEPIKAKQLNIKAGWFPQ